MYHDSQRYKQITKLGSRIWIFKWGSKWNSNQISLPCAKGIAKWKSKQRFNGIYKFRSKRCSQHHVNLKSKFKVQSLSKLRTRCSQEKDPIVTSNYAKMYNTFHPSYLNLFVHKGKIQTDVPTRDSDNIPHWDTWDPFFILKHYLANIL